MQQWSIAFNTGSSALVYVEKKRENVTAFSNTQMDTRGVSHSEVFAEEARLSQRPSIAVS